MNRKEAAVFIDFARKKVENALLLKLFLTGSKLSPDFLFNGIIPAFTTQLVQSLDVINLLHKLSPWLNPPLQELKIVHDFLRLFGIIPEAFGGSKSFGFFYFFVDCRCVKDAPRRF
jgi:hypothetical protein